MTLTFIQGGIIIHQVPFLSSLPQSIAVDKFVIFPRLTGQDDVEGIVTKVENTANSCTVYLAPLSPAYLMGKAKAKKKKKTPATQPKPKNRKK